MTPQTPRESGANRVRKLPIERIRPGNYQARQRFDPSSLDELASSIAESGVIQPVVVRHDGNDTFELLAGERRWRAAQIAGLQELPAILRDDISDAQAAILGLIENLQRESLGPLETARGLDRLCCEHGLTHAAASQRIGKSRAYVTNHLRLLRLAAGVQDMIDAGELTLGHAKVLAGVPVGEQADLARVAIKRRLSVRGLEKAWQQTRSSAAKHPALAHSAAASEMAELERNLSEQLGNAVNIRYNAERQNGAITIAFHSLDEFEGLLQRWGIRDTS